MPSELDDSRAGERACPHVNGQERGQHTIRYNRWLPRTMA